MTWTLFNLQLFLTQLLQDLWTSAPTGTSFKDLTTLVSQLSLQGTFYNLTVTGQLYLPFPTKNYTTHWASL